FFTLLVPCLLLIISYLIVRQPPTVTLFPYTTLFRSDVRVRRDPHLGRVGRPRTFILRPSPLSLCHSCGGPERARGKSARSLTHVDRKSTRLNSSHGSISYAVFCLKKKSKGRKEARSK